MPIDVFKPITNPVTGETFRCLAADESAYVEEWTVQPGGYVPFEHIHLCQDEIFHIKSGEARFVIEGKEIIGKAGESVTVAKGHRHIAFNNKNEILQCIVEYRPGLDSLIFAQCFLGLILDGYYDKHGSPSIPRMGYCIKGCKALTRPTNIPAAVFDIVINLFYFAGKVLGWKKLYKKYTGLNKKSDYGTRKL